MGQERTREEEIEYRRYLHRLKRREERRRKAIKARAIVGGMGLLLLILLVSVVRMGIRSISHHGTEAASKKETAVVSAEPTAKPLDYSVPEGMESYAAQLEEMREQYPEVKSILMNLYEYSESMLELVIKNPDTLEFVLGYPKHKADIKSSGEVTQTELEEAKNGIPHFLQWDTRWGYLPYGNDNIAINGCGPTCLSMVVTGLKQDLTQSPDQIAQFSMDNNYCTVASGTAWSLMSSGAKKLGLSAEAVVVGKETVQAQLKEGHPMICSLKPGDFTTTGHFIVLTGLTEEGEVVVNDPNSITRSEKAWKLDELVPQIKAAWRYTVTGTS